MKKQDFIIVAALLALVIAWPMFANYFFPASAPVKPLAPADAVAVQEPTPLEPAPPAATPAITSATIPSAQAAPEISQAPRQEQQYFTLTNADIKITGSSWGGGLITVELSDYRQAVDPRSAPVLLDFSDAPAMTYAALPGLSQDADFTITETDQHGVTLHAGDATGLSLQRRLILGANYQIMIEDTFFNESSEPITIGEHAIRIGAMSVAESETKNVGGQALGIDVLGATGGDGVKYWGSELPKLFKKQTAASGMPQTINMPVNAPIDWIAVKSKFFVQILRPNDGAGAYTITAERAMAPGEESDASRAPRSAAVTGVSAQARFAAINIAPQESYTRKFSYYVGPKKYSALRQLGLHQEKVMDFGMWAPLCVFLLSVLNTTYSLLPNYGLAIIVLTILIRILFWPLTHKSTESMKRMQELQPQMMELRKLHKNNPRKLQEETMALYKKNKVNPVSGCLPMIVQIPVFIALFVVLRSAIELRFAEFLWVKDLSEPERLFAAYLPIPLNILPIFMAVTQALQQYLTPTSDPNQQKMMLILMPGMMLVMFYMMPSALVLYWSANQCIMIIQQLIQKQRAAMKQNRLATPTPAS